MPSTTTVYVKRVDEGDGERVRTLLESGADPNIPSRDGELPLWYAEDDFGLEEIAALLRAHGAMKQARP